jgi:hypothetical protein
MNEIRYTEAGEIYSESQRITALWLKVISWGSGLGCFWGVALMINYKYINPTPDFENTSGSIMGLICLTLILSGILCVWAPYFTLHVKLTSQNLQLRFWPIKNKLIPASQITAWKIIEYRALKEYGGWGLRYSRKKGHWAYIMGGNQGVIISLANGEEVLVGSQQPAALVRALEKRKG